MIFIFPATQHTDWSGQAADSSLHIKYTGGERRDGHCYPRTLNTVRGPVLPTCRVEILHEKLWPKFRLAIGKQASHVWCSLNISSDPRCLLARGVCLIGRELVCDISSQPEQYCQAPVRPISLH